jgi:hypothetical protein
MESNATAILESEGLLGELSNHTDPPESRSPAGSHSHGAPENDRLAGAIEKENSQPVKNSQENICARCGQAFQPRKRSGGKPQKFCSTECRHTFHADRKANVGQRAQRATLETTLPALGAAPSEKRSSTAAEDDSSVVLHGQAATAIYFNGDNSLVIKQENWPDDDHYIIITESNIEAFLDRLTDICGVPSYPPKD